MAVATKFTTAELVEAVKAHAVAHYNDGGWDVVVETYSDEEIANRIGTRVSTVKGAIKAFGFMVDVWSERQADAIISAYGSQEAKDSEARFEAEQLQRDLTARPSTEGMWAEHADARDLEEYTLEQEMADEAAAGPYLGWAATADAEAHYLFTAGHRSFCDCSRCENAREAEYADLQEAHWLDFEATDEEIEQLIADLFASSVARQAKDFAPDPWAGDDNPPPF
jgi:hypothetical protein